MVLDKYYSIRYLLVVTLYLLLLIGGNATNLNGGSVSFKQYHQLENRKEHLSRISKANTITKKNQCKNPILHSICAASAAKYSAANIHEQFNREDEIRKSLKSLIPILASAFTAAAIMYPIDLLRALKMANAGLEFIIHAIVASVQFR